MLLRLYGMLNCAYQQGSAALQLHDLFRAPEKKQAVGAFGELELIRLRHIAGAHTVTYKDPQTGARKSFSLSRPSIRNETIVLYDDCNDPQEWDLFSAVMSYIDWAEAILFVICSKAIQTSLATSPVHLARFNSKLNVIQLRADGDDVDADDDGNILMHIKLSKEW